MLDVFKVADLLVAHTVANWGDEVDLIAYYGSHAKGTAGPRSDLDIFYTPAEGKNPPAGRTVLIEGILFDFWAIPWERLELWATGRDRGWSQCAGVIHHAKLLHARTGEQAERFAALKRRTLELQQPEARAEMVRRALDEFRNVLAHWSNLRLACAGGDLSDARHAGWELILAVRECLALANQMLLDQGGKDFLAQLAELPVRPAGLEPLVTTIATSVDPAEIGEAAERLALETRAVLRELQTSLPATATALTAFDGAYPETHAGLGKILTACERALPVDASLASWFAQFDHSLMLSALRNGAGVRRFNLYHEFASTYREIRLPELMPSAGDLRAAADRAREFDRRVRQWLQEQSVSLCEYATLDAFDRSLKGD